jgi:hypothetical protein
LLRQLIRRKEPCSSGWFRRRKLKLKPISVPA